MGFLCSLVYVCVSLARRQLISLQSKTGCELVYVQFRQSGKLAPCRGWKCPDKTLQWSALMSCTEWTLEFRQVRTSSGLQLLPEINYISWKVTHYSLHLERIPQLEISSYIPSMSSTFSLNLTLSTSRLFPVSLEFSTAKCLVVQVFTGSSLCWDWAHLISHWKKLSRFQIIIIDFFWTLLHLPTFF